MVVNYVSEESIKLSFLATGRAVGQIDSKPINLLILNHIYKEKVMM